MVEVTEEAKEELGKIENRYAAILIIILPFFGLFHSCIKSWLESM